MKKFIVLLILFIVAFFGFTKLRNSRATDVPKTLKTAVEQITPTPTPIVGIPVSIAIPALNITASVESVGMDSQGRMGVPEVATDTAWYKYGYRPGSNGSAVIDGHFDTPTGAPAIFYNIATLQRGDRITVTDNLNHTYTFMVTQVTSYPFDRLPMQEIFARNDKPRLNLITCDGTWDKSTHNYSNRAVVYAELTP